MFSWALPPAESVPTSSTMYDAFHTIFTKAFEWNYLVPISELLILLTFAILFWVVVIALSGVLWLIHLIRGN